MAIIRTYKRGYKPPRWEFLHDKEYPDAKITPKRVTIGRVVKLTFDRYTGEEITSHKLGSYRHVLITDLIKD